MDPVSKGRKLLSVEADIKQGVDRISYLPPDLIGKILSLLPIKEGVATSVLSPKWKWFWTFITRLDFNATSSVLQQPTFITFMYRFLYRRTTALDYLSVRCREMNTIPHFREWVSAALLVDVKELDLYIGIFDATYVLPFDLFSSKKLVKLSLGVFFQIDVPATVCLPSLKVLFLDRIKFPDDDSLRRLLIGCPILEDLKALLSEDYPPLLPQEIFSFRKLKKFHLRNCNLTNVPSSVSLPSLQYLFLHYVKFPADDSAKRLLCGCPSLQKLYVLIKRFKVLHVAAPMLAKLCISCWSSYAGSKIVLETPSLRYLGVGDMGGAESCELTDMNQLVEARISDAHSKAVPNLIMGLSSVKKLSLSGSVVEGIAKSGWELPRFHNLTSLTLGGVGNDVEWASLPDLLEKSPFLETLVFEKGLVKIGQDSSKNAAWKAPQKVPYCLLHHLKVIQINDFEGDLEEDEMIRYFIENRGTLKDLTIRYTRIWGISRNKINVVVYKKQETTQKL